MKLKWWKTILNWLNGITAFLVVLCGFIFALLSLRRYTKEKAVKTIFIAVISITVAFGLMGITISFFSILIYGYTLPEFVSYISYFSYSTIPIGSFAVIIISWDLLFSPKYKKLGLGFFCVVFFFFYLFLYLTWNQSVVFSNISGEIYDDWLSWTSVPYWMIWTMVGIGAVIWATGFNNFRKTTSGGIRKRAINLFFATFFIGSAILGDTVIFIGIFLDYVWVARLLMVLGVIFVYWGLAPLS